VHGIGSRGIAGGAEPAHRNGKAATSTGGLAHDVSSLIGVGRHLGSQSRVNIKLCARLGAPSEPITPTISMTSWHFSCAISSIRSFGLLTISAAVRFAASQGIFGLPPDNATGRERFAAGIYE
jgi:hypothetical protein